MFQIQDVDLRLLRVFVAIAEAGGITPAVVSLNVGRSTLSTQLGDLETRLGMRLCQRGRGGFVLTEDGQRVLDAARSLFIEIDRFRNATLRHDQLSGRLKLGIVDNTLTNPAAPVPRLIAQFRTEAPNVWLDISVEGINDLERHVLDGHLDLAIAAFHRNRGGLVYRELFLEENNLYCGKDHPLFADPREVIPTIDLQKYDFVGRGYSPRSISETAYLPLQAKATGVHMEATALLILSGKFIGYIPSHYGDIFVAKGQMRGLLPDGKRPVVPFDIAYGRSAPRNPVIAAFLAHCLPNEKGGENTALFSWMGNSFSYSPGRERHPS